MIVVDNNVIIPRYLSTPNSSFAHAVLSRDNAWIVPPLWKYEFVNVLCKYMRSGEIDEFKARDSLAQAEDDLGLAEVAVDQIDVLWTAKRYRISGYDAQYVSLAAKHGVVCVTDDRRLARQAGRHVSLLAEFTKRSS